MAAQTVIKLRRDTAANWTSVNPTLGSGEQGLETDTGKVKIGDGSTAWTSLRYASSVPDYETSATIAGTKTLSKLSARNQFITGSTSGYSLTLPDATTMAVGDVFTISNRSTQTIQIKLSDTTVYTSVYSNLEVKIICISNSVNTASSWATVVSGSSGTTGTNGTLVFSTSPSLTTPSLGVATATSINGTSIPSSKTLLATDSSVPATSVSTAASSFGYIGIPQVSTATGLTLGVNYVGKHIYTTATGQTHTIAANSASSLEIGATFVFINPAGVTTSIAINTDTLILAGPGTTGTRTLAPYGMATAVKITSTSWMISGNGLT